MTIEWTTPAPAWARRLKRRQWKKLIGRHRKLRALEVKKALGYHDCYAREAEFPGLRERLRKKIERG